MADIQPVRMHVRRRVFAPNADDMSFDHYPGLSVGQCLDLADYTVPVGCNPVVILDDGRAVETIEPEVWDQTEVPPGSLIHVATLPLGGGGGGEDKSIGQTLLMIAAVAVAVYAPPVGSSLAFMGETAIAGTSLTWGSVISGGLMLGAGMLAKPPSSQLSNLGGYGGASQSSPTYRIDDAANPFQPYGKWPRALGRFRWKPFMAAKPYREVHGGKLFYRVLLTAGYGPIKISDPEFGETPFADLPGIEVEIREGWDDDAPLTLFSDDVHEEPQSAKLTQADGWVTRTTLTNIDEAAFDLVAARLTEFTGNNQRTARSVVIEVQTAPVGTEDWTAAVWANPTDPGLAIDGQVTLTDNSTSEVWRAGRVKFATGQYKLRWRRTTADSNNDNVLDAINLVALRSIRYTNPITIPGVSKIALRIEAGNELQGTLPPVWVTTESYYQVYDSLTATWSWQLSTSPAWAALDALIHPHHNPRPAAAADIYVDAFVDWAADCAARGLACNGVIDYADTVQAVFNAIAETGFGRFSFNGIRYSAVWDRVVAAPTQHFSPHNTIAFKYEKKFVDPPHALLVGFKNEEQGFDHDVLPVYSPGFDEATATQFEEREYQLATKPAQIVMMARREIAVGIYRDIDAVLTSKRHHLVVNEGQTVTVTRPEIGQGLGSGRVVAADVLGADLSDPVPMRAGVAYDIAFTSQATGTRLVVDLQPVDADGEYLFVFFTEPLAAQNVPAYDDMFQFGETGFVSETWLVPFIDMRENVSADVHLVPYGPEVQAFIDGDNPPYVSRLSAVPSLQRRPAQPVLREVVSDETVLRALPTGSWAPQLKVFFKPRSGETFSMSHLDAQIRRTDAIDFARIDPPPAWDTTEVTFAMVDEGVAYDLRFRAVTHTGLTSEWLYVEAHTVVGKGTLPPDVPSVSMQGDKLVWPYPNAPIDFKGFMLRTRAGIDKTWADATVENVQALTVSEYNLSQLPSGVRTVMVKAIDVANNESANAAAVVLNLGDQPVANVITTRDYAAEDFPGQVVNGSLSAGGLEADDNGALYLPNPTAAYLPDGAALYLPLTFKEMVWILEYVPDVIDVPSTMTVDVTVTGADWTLEYRPVDEGLYLPDGAGAYLPSGGDLYLGGGADWQAWPGRLEGCMRARYQFRITARAGNTQGVIASCAIKLDVPDIEESFDDLIISAAGTRIPITKTYRKIVVVGGIAVQADGNGAVRIEVVDKDPILGPLLMGFDAANLAVAATIDITKLQGY